MDYTFSAKAERDRRSSFWRYLPSFPRKSKSKQIINEGNTTHVAKERDVTLISANRFYNSFRSLTYKKTPKRSADTAESRVAEEISDSTRNLHKDAGILFLTSDNQLRWRNHEDAKQKHVQFAPTPSNKYHTYDNSPRVGKENISPDSAVLKHVTDTTAVSETLFERMISHNSSKRMSILKENRFDQCDISRERLPRTSTRSALSWRQDVTIPSFNVSSITEADVNSRYSSSKLLSEDSIMEKQPRSFVALNQAVGKNEPCPTECNIGIPFVPRLKCPQRPGKNISSKKLCDTSEKSFFSRDCSSFQRSHSVRSKAKDEANVDQSIYEERINEVVASKGSGTNSGQLDFRRQTIAGSQVHCPTRNSDRGSRTHLAHGLQRLYLDDYCVTRSKVPPQSDCKKSDHSNLYLANGTFHDAASGDSRSGIDEFEFAHELRKFPSSRPMRKAEEPRASWRDRRIAHVEADSCYEQKRVQDSRFSFRLTPRNAVKSAFASMRVKSDAAKKYRLGPTTSSPNRTKSRVSQNCPEKKGRKYDGMSSMADDECSLNCSCVDCVEIVKGYSQEIPLTKKGSFKAKLFFPEDRPLAEEALPTGLSSGDGKNGVCRKSGGHWYECNDTMCESPSHHIGMMPTKNNEDGSKPISATEDVLIAEDYELIPETNKFTSTERVYPPVNEESNSLEDICLPEAATFRGSYPDMTPKTKKISESCVFALQETLKSLLHDSGSKPTFTISSCDSSGMADKPNTIVIQIQNHAGGTPQASENNDLSSRTSEIDEKRGGNHTLSRSRSLPQSLESFGSDKGENSIPMHAPTNLNLTKTATICDAVGNETIEYSTILQQPLEKTPDVTSNSGYSTVSSTLSIPTKDADTSAVNDKEILDEIIRLGQGLPPSKQMNRTSFSVLSPRKHKFKAKDVLSGRAKLKLNIYQNFGMVTVHVVKAVKLSSVRTMNLNPYVKVTLYPDESRRAHWRTTVVHSENNPVFDQKFSFEALPEDAKKRLIFSVWHRDKEKKRSEFLGCMSFGVHHVLEANQSLSGWYRLLKEVVGTRKHFAAGHGNALSKFLAR